MALHGSWRMVLDNDLESNKWPGPGEGTHSMKVTTYAIFTPLPTPQPHTHFFRYVESFIASIPIFEQKWGKCISTPFLSKFGKMCCFDPLLALCSNRSQGAVPSIRIRNPTETVELLQTFFIYFGVWVQSWSCFSVFIIFINRDREVMSSPFVFVCLFVMMFVPTISFRWNDTAQTIVCMHIGGDVYLCMLCATHPWRYCWCHHFKKLNILLSTSAGINIVIISRVTLCTTQPKYTQPSSTLLWCAQPSGSVVCLLGCPDSNVRWPNVGPTMVLSSRRWVNASPIYMCCCLTG